LHSAFGFGSLVASNLAKRLKLTSISLKEKIERKERSLGTARNYIKSNKLFFSAEEIARANTAFIAYIEQKNRE
jgi:alpha/beta superfamily hydrolase